MTIKSTLSIVALLSGIAFTGAAYAQTQVGNNDVSDADLPYVQQHCDALAVADLNSDIAGTNPDDVDDNTSTQDDIDARNTSTTVDLDTITLEDCRTAGLVQ